MAVSGRVKAPRNITVEPLRRTEVLAALAGTTAEWYEVTVRRGLLEVRVDGERAFVEPGMDNTALMRLGRNDEGRLICKGLILGLSSRDEQHLLGLPPTTGLEVRARDLRELPLAEILSQIADSIAKNEDAAAVFGIELKRSEPVSVRPGPKGHSFAHFQRVAEAYKLAIASGRKAPVKWLREYLSDGKPQPISDVTVRRWLRHCRKVGLLPPIQNKETGA